jgi:hypothetical protein
MAQLNFSADKVEPVGKFVPIPVGKYKVAITASERKKTNKEPKPGEVQGEMILFTYTVIDGEFRGRKLFDRLNIINANKTAQEIAEGCLSAICRSVGVMVPRSTEELHNIPFIVDVKIRAAKDGYDESNDVKGYARIDGIKLTDVGKIAASTPSTSAVSPEDAPSTAQGKKPWERKSK